MALALDNPFTGQRQSIACHYALFASTQKFADLRVEPCRFPVIRSAILLTSLATQVDSTSHLVKCGQVAEWLKAHAWKVCVR